MNLQPLWPVIVDDYCRDHDETLPCSQCAADASFNSRLSEMNEWLKRADLADSMVMGSQADRLAIGQWASYCRKRAAMLNGELMAEADREKDSCSYSE